MALVTLELEGGHFPAALLGDTSLVQHVSTCGPRPSLSCFCTFRLTGSICFRRRVAPLPSPLASSPRASIPCARAMLLEWPHPLGEALLLTVPVGGSHVEPSASARCPGPHFLTEKREVTFTTACGEASGEPSPPVTSGQVPGDRDPGALSPQVIPAPGVLVMPGALVVASATSDLTAWEDGDHGGYFLETSPCACLSSVASSVV